MKGRGVQIGRSEPCPCGSGRRYMDCCLSSKYLINYNYTNKAVMIDKDLTHKVFKEIMAFNQVLNKIMLTKKVLSIEDGIKALNEAYCLLERFLGHVIQFTSCEKGCNECCKKDIEISTIEAENIKNFINNYLREHDLRNIFKNVNADSSNTICPFISSEGTCIIYLARPMKCRSYYVFSDPVDCNDDNSNVPLIFTDANLSLLENIVDKISRLVNVEDYKLVKKTISQWLIEIPNIMHVL